MASHVEGKNSATKLPILTKSWSQRQVFNKLCEPEQRHRGKEQIDETYHLICAFSSGFFSYFRKAGLYSVCE